MDWNAWKPPTKPVRTGKGKQQQQQQQHVVKYATETETEPLREFQILFASTQQQMEQDHPGQPEKCLLNRLPAVTCIQGYLSDRDSDPGRGLLKRVLEHSACLRFLISFRVPDQDRFGNPSLDDQKADERVDLGITSKTTSSVLGYISLSQEQYVLRTEKSFPNDVILAVSWRWSKDGGAVQAFLHGCQPTIVVEDDENVSEADAIKRWFDEIPTDQAFGAWKHPLLPALLVGEMQLSRHRHHFHNYKRLFDKVFNQISTAANQPHLADHLKNAQVSEWFEEIREMFTNHHQFHRIIVSFISIVNTLVKFCGEIQVHGTSGAHDDFRIASESVACRFRQLHQDYSTLEGEAQYLVNGTSLLQKSLWSVTGQKNSQINTKISDTSRAIAKAASQDSSAMRALAVITAIFLPATTIATIMTMPVMDWSKHFAYPDIRGSIWIFVVTTLVLTSATLYSWRCWYLRDLWKRDVNSRVDETMANGPDSDPENQQVGDDSDGDNRTKQGKDEIRALMIKGKKAQEHRKRVLSEVRRKLPYPLRQLFRLERHYQLPDEEAMVDIFPRGGPRPATLEISRGTPEASEPTSSPWGSPSHAKILTNSPSSKDAGQFSSPPRTRLCSSRSPTAVANPSGAEPSAAKLSGNDPTEPFWVRKMPSEARIPKDGPSETKALGTRPTENNLSHGPPSDATASGACDPGNEAAETRNPEVNPSHADAPESAPSEMTSAGASTSSETRPSTLNTPLDGTFPATKPSIEADSPTRESVTAQTGRDGQ
ncbi:uncharacterized protein PV07_12146 [Cladophialophora immunda]|uniref:Uncharacterized protein n=1 Tax=Cladophialophora immunda TaxID=569365 RepID=A0A0D2BUY5_9EURO|nr:uncharacterized protein PV07_12146 [Cladophialophora immunda]KIW22240.1 hypothetical protein PV07_12146 [Cladophialophora immunda]